MSEWVEIPMEPQDGVYPGAGYGEDYFGEGDYGGAEGFTIDNWEEVSFE